MASEVAKGDALQKSKYGIGLDGKGLGKYESDMTDIEKSKSDSMFGQAKGVRKNYGVNKDMYSQNAEYGEESKQQATNAKIATQGGIAAAVATDVKAASMQAAEQVGNVDRKWGNINNVEFLQNQIAGLESAGADMSEFRGKTGLDYLRQMGASQAMKSMMKDSIVDANGKSVSFATGKDGSIGMASIDGQTKIANGVNVDTGGQAAALTEGFNMTEAAIKDGHHVDIQNGKLVGSKASKEAWMKHVGNNQKNQAIVASAPGEFLTILQDLAEEFTPEAVADNFGKVAFAGVMGAMGYKLTSNAFGKKPSVKTNSETNGGTSDKSEDSVNHDNASFNSDMQDYTQNKQNLQEEFKDIGKQKQELAAKYNSGKMSKEDYTSKFNSLDAKQMSLTNDLDNMDRYIKAEETKAEAENNKKTINRMPPEAHNNESGGSVLKTAGKGAISLVAASYLNNLAESLGIDPSQSRIMSAIQNVSGLADGATGAIGTAFGSLGTATGELTKGNFANAGSAVVSGLSNAGSELAQAYNHNLVNADARFAAQNHSAAPQHQGFTTLSSGHYTAQAISADMQQQAAQAQITMANNTQALSAIAPNSVTPNRSYVGFTMQDADQNPVSFTTDKASRNMMVNGYDTGIQAQQFSSMMQNPDAVNQFANAISQTSFSNVEAYNATNNILSEMNAQSQRAMMQQKVHNNASDTNRTLQHKEMVDINRQSKEEEHEF